MRRQKYILTKFERFRRKIDRRFIVFGIFLLIATFFWFLNALSRNYTSNIKIPIVYKNFPSDKVIINDLPEELNIRVEAFGFALLKHQLKIDKLPISLDVSRAIGASNSNKAVVLTNSHKDEFDSKISSEFTVQHIYPDSIQFQFSKIYTKMVPVRNAITLSFDKQFQLQNEIQFIPDSIEISGPQFILDTINSVKTSELMLENLNRSVQRNVGLESINKIKLSEHRVVAYIEVEKYTEEVIRVPIKLLHVPDSLSVLLADDAIDVKFIVGLSKYNEYSAENFEASIDCDTLKSKPERFRIQFQHPYDLEISSYFPKEVDYILKKK